MMIVTGSFAVAQGPRDKYTNPEMKRKVIHALDGKEKGWEPIDFHPAGEKGIISIYRNKGVERPILLRVSEMDSVEKAIDWLKSVKRGTSGGYFKAAPNLGDEAHMVIGLNLRGAGLRIRTGKTIIYVDAPSEDLATKFVKHLLKEFGAQ
ncbi:MAG: hypothetical protein L0220_31115 [Acidobacteria bacterium]|nr:hypothetical protein [Acidobacteriota bacterium]